jgi:hypothetical protein
VSNVPVVTATPAKLPENKFVDPTGGITCFGAQSLVVESYTSAVPSVGTDDEMGILLIATADLNG